MKFRFHIVPHLGVLPVMLNAERHVIRQTLSEIGLNLNHANDPMDYYLNNALQVEFTKIDNKELASFIGICAHETAEVFFKNMNVFNYPAEQVFDFIKQEEPNCIDEYSEYEHLFEHQILAVWDADEQYDRAGERFPVWGQLGVGNALYLKAIRDLRAK